MKSLGKMLMARLSEPSTWIALLSLLVSIVAVVCSGITARQANELSVESNEIANESMEVAQQAQQDARAVARLDEDPQIRHRSYFNTEKPYLKIFNEGQVDALNLKIQLFAIRHISQDSWVIFGTGGFFGASCIENEKRFERLKALDNLSLVVCDDFPDHFTLSKEPLTKNVIELRLTYSRGADLKQYLSRTFYFYNPEGKWVLKGDLSLNSPIYKDMKETIHSWDPNIIFDDRLYFDEIHEFTAE